MALIERERTGPVRDALLALEPDDRCMALRQLIEVAVRHQLRRSALAMPLDFHRLPVMQTFFLCESHETLTSNTYFQNNLLYFLLSR